MTKTQKIRINPRSIFEYIYYPTLFLSLIILVLVLFFIYQNVYLTITKIKAVATLREHVTQEQLETGKFELIKQAQVDKIKPLDFNVANIKQIF